MCPKPARSGPDIFGGLLRGPEPVRLPPAPLPGPRQRYLVTGCAGFIGSAVCWLLLKQGHRVLGIDNLDPRGYDARLKKFRLKPLEFNPDFSFRRVDIKSHKAIHLLFSRAAREADPTFQTPPFAAVFNLAARAGVRASVAHLMPFYDTNVRGTMNLLASCKLWGVSKFILASTSSLYGVDNPVPFREDADTSRPISHYAASKQAAETLAYTYHYLHNIDVSVLRYFTVYGPAGRPDMSVFRFIRHLIEGERILLYGDGSHERDFTYVDDIAEGTVAALAPCGYEIINLGSDRPVSINRLIDTLAGLAGREPIIERHPSHPADVPRTWADITKAREMLGWRPRFSLEDGLQFALEWYRCHRTFAQKIDVGEGYMSTAEEEPETEDDFPWPYMPHYPDAPHH